MLVGIMSDSHDNLPAIARAVELFNSKKVGAVLHAGDLVAPFTARELFKLTMPLTIIFGNNDGERSGLQRTFGERIHQPPYSLILENKKILLLHDPELLTPSVTSGDYDLVIFGHTHQPEIRRENCLIINPGECGGWLTGQCTVALWETATNEAEIVNLDKL